MEDVVEAFKHARPGALSYAKKLDSDVPGQIKSPKRKLSSVADEDEDVRPRKATRASKRRAATGAVVHDTTVVEEIESDGDYQEEGMSPLLGLISQISLTAHHRTTQRNSQLSNMRRAR